MAVALRESVQRAREVPQSLAVLRGRAELLTDADRDLLEAVLVHGNPTESLARMLGVSCSAVRKRVRRLMRRLTSPSFLDAARALPYLEKADADLARLYFCEGASQEDAALSAGITRHQLRYRLARLRAEIAVLSRLRRRNGPAVRRDT